MIPKETIDIIFDTARIEEVVGDFVTLKKRGVNLLGNCPFHNEKTPSFTVSPTKGIYKCFGCGQAGNAVKFVMDHEHYTYPEALRYLARKYNIEIEEEQRTNEEQEQLNEKESLYIVSAFAQKHFTENLLESDEGKAIGLSYFKERGFKENTVEKFQLGYSIDKWSGFTDAALQKGYLLENLVKTGLSIQKESSTPPTGFDRFSGRVMFPIHNLSGRVIAFGGRTLKADKKTAKYINSPETDIYSKSKVLYGAFFAKKAIIGADNCYLVEGYTDVISFHQAGIENVVASSGTSLTVEQIRLIKRYTKNITILYDGDAAGIKASFRGIDLILEEGMNVKIVLFPDGEDPDSYAKKSTADELKEFITANANDFIVFKSNLLLAEAQNDPIKKAGLIREIIQSIALIDDGINRSVYVKECSRILDVSEQALINELNKVRKASFNKKSHGSLPEEDFVVPPELEQQDQIEINSCESQERDIVRILLTHGNKTKIVEVEDEEDNGKVTEIETTVASFIIGALAEDSIEFETAAFQLIFNEFIAQMEKEEIPGEHYFINHPDPKISSTAINLLTSPYSLSEGWERHNIIVEGEDLKLKRMVLGAVYSLKNKKVEQMIQKNQLALKEDKPYEELIVLIQQQKLLLEAKQALSAHLGRIILK